MSDDLGSSVGAAAGEPLLGRDAPLAALLEMVVEVGARRRGRLALLAGEPGIGKTTLADAVGTRAAERGARVAWGRAWESGGAPSYWPWTQALETLLRALPDDAARVAVARAGPDAVRVVPAFAAHVEGGATKGTDAESARFAAGRVVAALLSSLAPADGPLVVVLDDLHAADLATLHALLFIARELRSLPVLVIGTFRDVEARLDDDKATLLAAVQREGSTITLARLARDDTAVLARRSATIDSDLEQAIWEATRGNPLFVDEVAHMIAQELHAEGGARATGGVPIPFGVREIIRQRLALLADDDRAVLEAIALAGDDVALPVIAAVTRRAAADVDAVLTRLAGAGALAARVRDEVPRFTHALFREVVERDLPATRRASLHRATADTLAQRRAPPLVEIAHHRLAARHEHPEEALAAVEVAALSLVARGAYDDALALAQRAADDIIVEPGSALACRAELLLGEALIAAGREREGVDTCVRAAEAAQRRAGRDGAVLLARAALAAGRAWSFGRADADLARLLDKARAALESAGGGEALLARVEGRLAGALQPAPLPAEPIALAKRAIARARATGDDAAILDTIHTGMSAMMDFEDAVDRMPLNEELLERALRAGDRGKALRARLRLIFDLVELGELDAVDDAIDAYAVAADELGHATHTWVVPMMRAMMALTRGEVGRHDEFVTEAKQIASTISERFGEQKFFVHMLATARLLDDVDLLRTMMPKLTSIAAMGAPGLVDFIVGWTAWRTGDLDEARRRFARHHTMPSLDPALHIFAAEALGDAGAVHLAESCLAVLLPRQRRLFSFGMTAFSVEEPIARHCAFLARALGRFDQARALHEEALAFAERIGAHGFLPRLRRELASCPRASTPALSAPDAATSARATTGASATADTGARATTTGAGATAEASATAPSTQAGMRIALARDGDVWRIDGGAAAFRLKDSRGLQMLSVLVARAGEDVHALELASASAEAVDGGDAGEALDDVAKAQYRARLRALDARIDDAEDDRAQGRGANVERLVAEKEALVRELARGLGLGGRARRTGSAGERARVAVQRRLRDAIEKVRGQDAALGAHLDRCLRTGTSCCYRP